MSPATSPRRPGRSALALLAVLGLAACGASTEARGGAQYLPDSSPETEVRPSGAGVAAPGFAGQLLDGTEVELAGLHEDRMLLLHFMTSWCTQCADMEEGIATLQERYGEALLVLGVGTGESADELRDYLEEHDAQYPVLLDEAGTVWRSYAATEPPVTALVDPAGDIVRMWPGGAEVGELDAEMAELHEPASGDHG